MSITTELREFVDGLACHKSTRDLLRGIADRIDQQHEECTGFCRRLEDAASKGEEVTIFGTDYVPLPTDAEGIPFHVGDHVEVPDGPPDAGRPNVRGMIVALKLGVVTWHIHVKLPNGNTTRHLVENVHHVQPDSWAGIIDDAFHAGLRRGETFSMNEFIELVERCKKLAGDAK